MGTRIVVLAKEGPEAGSRVTLDYAVPEARDIAELARQLERDLSLVT